MLYEYNNKYYIRVSNKYVEVNIKKKTDGTFDIIPTKNKEYVEKMPNVISVTVEQAYKKSNKNIESLKD